MSEVESIKLSPQEGPQTMFLESKADIAIFGGAAGGGKTFGLLLEPLRHYHVTGFDTVIFRRNSTQVRNAGGLWDESARIYPLIGALPNQANLQWRFPTKRNKLKFAHLENEKTVYDWQGAQIPLIMFDELTHFTEFQFFYMMSRNRSMTGVKGYIRATCNPDCDSWVRKFIDWWIGPDGLPIAERSGVLRWFIRIGDVFHWADSEFELKRDFGKDVMPKSVTFISSRVYDNKILMEKDPSYLANLMSQDRVERERLLNGNWNVRASAGMYFKKHYFEMVDTIKPGWVSAVRFWDRAATKPHEGNKDPDWTRGLLMYRYPDGTYLVADLRSMRDTPLKVEQLIRSTASYDGGSVRIVAQRDPGSAGVGEAENFIRMLVGFDVRTVNFSKDKVTRAKPVSAQAEGGFIKVLRAPWNDDFFSETENFPQGAHDDIVDTLSGAFNELVQESSAFDYC